MRKGFSLVELAIVLVILGLLVGGVMAGQSLIRASELRRVATDMQKYQIAIKSFRGKHRGLPGDTALATSYYGARGGTAADGYTTSCATGPSSGPATCNGNHNGIVDHGTYEMFTFWQHLSNAGLIEGAYTGFHGSEGTLDHDRGRNAPSATLSQATWYTYDRPQAAGDAVYFTMETPRALGIGRDNGGDTLPNGPVMRPEEAWNIDGKVDDERPGTGRVIAVNWDSCTNAPTRDGRMEAQYVLGNKELLCSLLFVQAI